MAAPPDVQEIVAAHAPHFTVVEVDGRVKVKCELNGHTFPAQAAALEAFVSGKKYGKLVREARLDTDLSKYEPFIVRSKNLPGMLFCALTGELLNARLPEVRQHMKGRKFGRAKERFEADELELLEEPDVAEDMEEDEDGMGIWVPDEVLQEYEMEDAEEAEGGEDAEEEGEEEGEEEEGEEGEAGQAADAEQQQQQQQEAAPAAGGGGKATGGKRQKQQKQPGKGGAPAAEQDGAAGGKGGKGKKQRQQQPGEQQPQQQGQKQAGKQQKGKGAANGSSGGGSGKAKPPKAKRVRTG